jgi:hypothetical protein
MFLQTNFYIAWKLSCVHIAFKNNADKRNKEHEKKATSVPYENVYIQGTYYIKFHGIEMEKLWIDFDKLARLVDSSKH